MKKMKLFFLMVLNFSWCKAASDYPVKDVLCMYCHKSPPDRQVKAPCCQQVYCRDCLDDLSDYLPCKTCGAHFDKKNKVLSVRGTTGKTLDLSLDLDENDLSFTNEEIYHDENDLSFINEEIDHDDKNFMDFVNELKQIDEIKGISKEERKFLRNESFKKHNMDPEVYDDDEDNNDNKIDNEVNNEDSIETQLLLIDQIDGISMAERRFLKNESLKKYNITDPEVYDDNDDDDNNNNNINNDVNNEVDIETQLLLIDEIPELTEEEREQLKNSVMESNIVNEKHELTKEEKQQLKISIMESKRDLNRCPQCNNIKHLMKISNKCNHRICKECFKNLIKNIRNCPTCNAPIYQNNIIKNFKKLWF
ncbi:protein PFC0760c-like isoform X3 [Daktulosphaira vitifoliae]|uniref:protein PFC0760c-like isoform X3 n=1 Tax=Daktulosphaira vitifoliae TaxID=58002 RepID=UPI0021AA4853|nr:protein PFC0760c-like isoform X3 [Daktulosphaira vitifoliae]